MLKFDRIFSRGIGLLIARLFLVGSLALVPSSASRGQDPSAPEARGTTSETSPPVLEDGGPSAQGATPEPAPRIDPLTPPVETGQPRRDAINALNLFFEGGIFMYPITALSFVGVLFAIERLIGLRRARVLPRGLIRDLGVLASLKSGFDPRQAYRICQQYPSAAANVIRAMLLKVGRPHSEVEHTVKEACEREAERLYRNVRWQNLCASIAPLLGLLGTIQGMIMAFHQTTQLAPGANKATELAHGIYVALVTTFAGLVVAIPAATLSHYFEGRIQALFHEIDELLFSLLPQIERYEGRVRFGRSGAETERDREGANEPPPFKDPLPSPKEPSAPRSRSSTP